MSRKLAGAIFSFLVLLLSVMFWLQSSRQTRTIPGSLRIPILATSAVQTLDPIKSVELVQYNLDSQIFECLVSVDWNGRITSGLAESWTTNDDKTVWTFKLRESRFADNSCFEGGRGRRITSKDVEYSMLRGLSPTRGSLNSWALSNVVVGAAEYANGTTTAVSGVDVVDDKTIQFKLNRPYASFPSRLTVMSTAIVPKEAIERSGEAFGLNPVGSGPYKLRRWVPGEQIVLEPNRNHPSHSAAEGAPDLVVYDFFRSESQIASAFERREIDMRPLTASDLGHGAIRTETLNEIKLGENSRPTRPGNVCRLHLLAPTIGEGYVFGKSPALRRWLASVFPHKTLSASALGPVGKVTKELLLPRPFLLDSVSAEESPTTSIPSHRSPDELRNATIRIAYASNRTNDVIIQLLREILEKAHAKVQVFPAASVNALFASIDDVKPDLTLIYWSPYYPSVEHFLTALLSSSRPVPNFTGYENDELDQQARLLQSGNGDINAIRDILNREMPWIPLYYDTPVVVVSNRVSNFRVNPLSVDLLTDSKLAQ